jgi:hypothetical protein
LTNASEELTQALAEQKALEEKIKELKAKSKEEDLKTVKDLITLHGFTPTALRGVLKKGKSTVVKSGTKKAAAKKKAA